MITLRELATVRAALRYWQEEMCPHGQQAMQHYFDQSENEPLSSGEINNLRERLATTTLRYGHYDPAQEQLSDLRLLPTIDHVIQAATEPTIVITVLLPV